MMSLTSNNGFFEKGELDKQGAINELNRYLEENMSDKEAWLELADIYHESLELT